jgi:hypothetical protein
VRTLLGLLCVLLLSDPTASWYSSRAGVILATMFIVAVLKRLLATVPYANQVPTWVYAAVVAGNLTYLLNQVFHTLPGDNVAELLWYAITTAATAGGFHQWFYGGLSSGDISKPLASSASARERLINQKLKP